VVVAGNFTVGRKNICCQNGNPYQGIDLWCGTKSFPVSPVVVVPSSSFHCQLHGLTQHYWPPN
jgi:hypothetical protein